MISISTSKRNGLVVGAVLVEASDEIMLVSNNGILVRTLVSKIRQTSRSAQGVMLIALDSSDELAGMEKVIETDDEEREEQEALDL